MITWSKTLTAAMAGCLSAVIAAAAANAAEIIVRCHANVRPTVEAVIPALERASGHKVNITYIPGAALSEQTDDGTGIDLAIAFSDRMDGFIKAGKFAGGSRFELVRSSIGVAVRAGAPKPDVSSASALTDALLAAKSVAFSQGPTGTH